MGYLDEVPQWNPPSLKKHAPTPKKIEEGWNIDERPPAGYFNWFWSVTAKAIQVFDTHDHDYKYIIRGEDGAISEEMLQSNIINNEHLSMDFNLEEYGVADTAHDHDSKYLNKNGDTMSGSLTIGRNALLKKVTSNSVETIISSDGRVWNAVYNDIAEMYKADKWLKENQVLVWDGEKVTTTTEKEDKRVIGVYSDTYAQCLGGQPDSKGVVPIGISGKVKVKVKGPVSSGDLLTTSEIPGVAVKSENKELGTIFGKAMTDVKEDKIKIIWAFIAVI